MNVYKKFVFGVLFLNFTVLAPFIVLLWVYDPAMFFHKPFFRALSFKERLHERYIIDHYDFDSLILGTSMLQNTDPKEAEAKLGGKWVNLSINGAHFSDRNVIFNYALKHKNIQRVLSSLDAFALIDPLEASLSSQIFGSFKDNMAFYLHKHFIFCALIYSTEEKCVGKTKRRIENFNNWIEGFEDNAIRFGGLENWFKGKYPSKDDIELLKNANDDFKNQVRKFDLKKQEDFINKELFSYIKAYPHIQFELIVPSYHKAFYKATKLENHLAKYQQMIKFIVNETSKYQNAKVYGFDDLAYGDDIRNYKDLGHYNVDMNSMQLEAIRDQKHILTPQNIDEYLAKFEEKVINYDLKPLKEIIKKYEQENKKS
ncbi:hypothetical protein DMB92_06165 [Campylobacter sp. MIT 99-7217]|uniref:hypothetical protein n=1 Tax=Campylobacter sp. MIT 99-7217 TaxID=535091 RepID=UPI0011571E2A|nr:hypothetical protein [Campylobacter sp. MIT 99-7217]TQR31274.1 hypothetical protein DMB92_06165 [Campylobacter sp. MIT 99-7217]